MRNPIEPRGARHTDSAGTFIAGRREADIIGTGSPGLSRTFRVKREWLWSVTPSAVVTSNYFLTSRNTQDFDHLDFNVDGGVTLGVGARSSLSLNLAAGGFGQNTRSYSGQIRFSMPF